MSPRLSKNRTYAINWKIGSAKEGAPRASLLFAFAFRVVEKTALVILDKRVAGLSELALTRFVARARRAARLRGRVNVLITSSAEMKTMNRRFRRKDEATDVLSFPAAKEDRSFAGDIAISAEVAARNARSLGHGPAAEVKILVLHGILHLRGYDHERDGGKMARREQKLRRELRLPVGLIERSRPAATMPDGMARRWTRRP